MFDNAPVDLLIIFKAFIEMSEQSAVDSTFKKRLEEYFFHSSPEQYHEMEKRGLLAQAIDSVVDSVQPIQGPNADSFSVAKERLSEVVIQTLSNSKPKILSADVNVWEGDLSHYLATSGPESFAEAVKLARLDPHVRYLAARGRVILNDAMKSGVKEARARQAAEDWILAHVSPIPVPVDEWMAVACGSRAMTLQQFEQVVERHALGAAGERFRIAFGLMSVLLERPEFGSLLRTNAFKFRFDEEPLYHLCLCAQHFGASELDAAITSILRTLALDPSPIAFTCLANCFRAQGQWEKALSVLDDAIRQFPGEQRLCHLAAGTAFATGNSTRANAYLAPCLDDYFANFPRRDYVEMRRQELEQAVRTHQLYREGAKDLYDDAFAYSTWWNYWYHFNSYTRHQHPEGVLADVVPGYLSEVIARLIHPPKAFVEIGTMCGEIVDRLASRFPKTFFFGVDRQQNVKTLNDAAFRRENLEFVADDIFAFMAQRKEALRDGMLFHVRTAPFLLPAFLEKLYRQSGDQGIRYIALFETYSLSYSKRIFRTFSEMDEIAEIRSGGLIHHNYPRLLEQAGFRVIHQEIARPTLLFSGMDNSVFMVAERME